MARSAVESRGRGDGAPGLEAAGHRVTGYQVQRMAEPGVEMLVGVVQDQHFGPVLACGAGGTATELVKDVAVRITPITRGEAARMVRSLKTFPLLDGYRGAPRGRRRRAGGRADARERAGRGARRDRRDGPRIR